MKTALDEALPGTYWVRAETSEVRVNATSGHCYLEFVEKNETTGQLVAKSRGTIWARNFAVLRTYFKQETKQTFISGLKVLVAPYPRPPMRGRHFPARSRQKPPQKKQPRQNIKPRFS